MQFITGKKSYGDCFLRSSFVELRQRLSLSSSKTKSLPMLSINFCMRILSESSSGLCSTSHHKSTIIDCSLSKIISQYAIHSLCKALRYSTCSGLNANTPFAFMIRSICACDRFMTGYVYTERHLLGTFFSRMRKVVSSCRMLIAVT